MNARQKAKKYKKELDRLRSLPVKHVFVTENHKIETIRATYMVDPYDKPVAKYYENRIFMELCHKIAQSTDFTRSVIFNYKTDEFTGNTIYTAEIKVLR